MYRTIGEVAGQEGVSVGVVLEWISQGLEVHEGPRGDLLIAIDDLAEFLTDDADEEDEAERNPTEDADQEADEDDESEDDE